MIAPLVPRKCFSRLRAQQKADGLQEAVEGRARMQESKLGSKQAFKGFKGKGHSLQRLSASTNLL